MKAFVLRLEELIGKLESFLERCPLVPENEILQSLKDS